MKVSRPGKTSKKQAPATAEAKTPSQRAAQRVREMKAAEAAYVQQVLNVARELYTRRYVNPVLVLMIAAASFLCGRTGSAQLVFTGFKAHPIASGVVAATFLPLLYGTRKVQQLDVMDKTEKYRDKGHVRDLKLEALACFLFTVVPWVVTLYYFHSKNDGPGLHAVWASIFISVILAWLILHLIAIRNNQTVLQRGQRVKDEKEVQVLEAELMGAIPDEQHQAYAQSTVENKLNYLRQMQEHQINYLAELEEKVLPMMPRERLANYRSLGLMDKIGLLTAMHEEVNKARGG